jgi:HEPN domain-containing protein
VDLLASLLADYPELDRFKEAAQQLDQYYIPARYPNGLPGGVPAEVFTRSQAEGAVAAARDLMAAARAAVAGAR